MRSVMLPAAKPVESDVDWRDREGADPLAPVRDKGGFERRGKPVDKTVEDIRDCLTEQIRLLGAAPDFANKTLVANCAHVALMLVRQLSLRCGRP